jgi:dipeptidyl aminopeptidase/acylaminoacyl peptidase
MTRMSKTRNPGARDAEFERLRPAALAMLRGRLTVTVSKANSVRSQITLGAVFVLVTFVSGVVLPLPTPAADLIPRKVLLGAPTRTAASVSPDGKWLAYLAPSAGVMNVWAAPLDNIGDARVLSTARTRPITEFSWAPDSARILYLQDHNGDEQEQLFGAPLRPGPVISYTPFENANTTLVAQSPLVAGAILISSNKRDPRWPDVYRLDLDSGALHLVWRNPGGYRAFHADRQLTLRLVEKARDDGGYEADRLLPHGSLVPLLQTRFEDSQTTAVVSIGGGGKTAYLLDSRDRDTAALKTLDLTTGATHLIAAEPSVDIASNSDGGVGGHHTLIVDPRTGAVQAYSVNDLTLKWEPVGAELAADIRFLNEQCGGQWLVQSQSADNELWTLLVDRPGRATLYMLFDRRKHSLTPLFSERPQLDTVKMAETEPLEIRSRDGKRLVSYLTLPSHSALGHRNRQPLPAVLVIHGGPDERNVFGYDGRHQWLADRGYAVLSINYRGSTGFGKSFTNSRAWSPDVSNDMLDGVDWLVNRGIAARDRVAILGGSYGGYATLAGLTLTPLTYACGVDAFGPTDLPALLSRNSVRPEWNADYEHLVHIFGDPRTSEGRSYLEERSPETRVSELLRPILIAQGANDPRVRKIQSDQFVDALERRHVVVTYVVFPDEGHGFLREANSLAFAAVSEAFLHRCLGGRLEPIGADIRGSSLSVPIGKEWIPGLERALGSASQ